MAYTLGNNPDPEKRKKRPYCVFESGSSSPLDCFATPEGAAKFKDAREKEDIQKNDFEDSAPAPKP